MQRTITAISTKKTEEEIFNDICFKFYEVEKSPILIVFFAERDYFSYLATNLKKAFPAAITIGSTSFLSFCDKGTEHKGAVAMAIFSGIECAEGVIFEIGKHPANYIMNIKNAVESLSTYENTCCLQFNTAYSNGEELVMDTFEEGFEGKPIVVFGGSSGTYSLEGDEISFVSLNGEVYQNACVFCLIHNLEGRILYYKENIFKPTKNKFQTTDVDCEERKIYELDNRPAADVLAEALNVPLESLKKELFLHPIGRIVDDQIFITQISDVFADGSIKCLSRIYNRSKIALLQIADVENVWKEATENLSNEIDNISFTFIVNCMGRSILFEDKKLLDKYSDFLKKNFDNYIGLSGFGEQLRFTHLNQTMIVAMFE